MASGGLRPGAGRPRKDGLPIGSPIAKRVREKAPKKAQVKLARKTRSKPDKQGLALGAEFVKGYTAPDGAKVADAPKDWPFGTKPAEDQVPPDPLPDADGIDPATGLPVDPKIDPLELLERIAQNPCIDLRSRIQAANCAVPYRHPKKGESLKKNDKEEAAKRAASKFAPAAGPLKLVRPGA